MVAVKAHFDGKVIVPDEPVTLPENEPLVVTIKIAKRSKRARKKSALDQIASNAVADDDLPPDLGYQHDHYLHGMPKKPEAKP